MAKAKGARNSNRQNGKASKKHPLKFDPIKRKLVRALMPETLFNLSLVVIGVLVLAFVARLVDERDEEDLGYRDDEEL